MDMYLRKRTSPLWAVKGTVFITDIFPRKPNMLWWPLSCVNCFKSSVTNQWSSTIQLLYWWDIVTSSAFFIKHFLLQPDTMLSRKPMLCLHFLWIVFSVTPMYKRHHLQIGQVATVMSIYIFLVTEVVFWTTLMSLEVSAWNSWRIKNSMGLFKATL